MSGEEQDIFLIISPYVAWKSDLGLGSLMPKFNKVLISTIFLS